MRKQHEKFRIEEVSYIAKRWKSPESVSLVGVGSVGKSNLLQHLTNPDVYATQLGVTQNQFQAVIIDPFLLGALPTSGDNVSQFTCWAGMELVMHRLYMTFFPFDFLSDRDAEYIDSLYEMFQDGTNPLTFYLGLRQLELALKVLFNNNLKIVLMFDEFEEFLRIMPYRFFQMLRALRDTYKRNFSFLTFSRNTFPILIDQLDLDYDALEPFIELFNDNVLYVGPYNDYDARLMLENLATRNPHINYSPQENTQIMNITGNFAGLVRATFRVLHEMRSNHSNISDTQDTLEKLANKPSIKIECNTIWLSLSPLEREILRAVARLSVYQDSEKHEDAIRILIQKRLLVFKGKLEIVPPIFRYFVYSDPLI